MIFDVWLKDKFFFWIDFGMSVVVGVYAKYQDVSLGRSVEENFWSD